MLTQWQLEKHNKSITASKIAAVIGISPWATPYSLYQEMTGAVTSEIVETERMKMGSYMEDALTKYCINELGWSMGNVPETGKEHPVHPYLWCLPDRLKIDCGEEYVIEFKNIDGMFRSEWEGNGPPDYYKSQVHFQSMIYDLPGIIVSCFGGNEVKYWVIERDLGIEEFLYNSALGFWGRLQSGNPPETDGHEATSAALKRLFPRSSGELIEGTPELYQSAVSLEELSASIKDLEKKKEEIQNLVKAAIGPADGFLWPDGTKITWKKDKDGIKFDEETFQLEHPETYEHYQKTKPGSRRFLVSLGKGYKT